MADGLPSQIHNHAGLHAVAEDPLAVLLAVSDFGLDDGPAANDFEFGEDDGPLEDLQDLRAFLTKTVTRTGRPSTSAGVSCWASMWPST